MFTRKKLLSVLSNNIVLRLEWNIFFDNINLFLFEYIVWSYNDIRSFHKTANWLIYFEQQKLNNVEGQEYRCINCLRLTLLANHLATAVKKFNIQRSFCNKTLLYNILWINDFCILHAQLYIISCNCPCCYVATYKINRKPIGNII